jgi:DnaJ-class molecular chaperone
MLIKTQLEAVVQIMDKLSHYQLLKISPTASRKDIQEAFHREAYHFHPDQYQSSADPALLDCSKKIYSRIVEAYRTLISHEKREAYDKINKIFHTQIITEVNEVHANTITSAKAKTPGASAGQRFFKMAQGAAAQGQYQAAKMNLQIALNADPNNQEFLHLLSRIEAQMKKSSQQTEKK